MEQPPSTASTPSLARVSSGLYALARPRDRAILDELRAREHLVLDGSRVACREALVRCQVDLVGGFVVVACGYLFPSREARDARHEIYVVAYPPRQGPDADDRARVKRVELVDEYRGELVLRCVLEHLRNEGNEGDHESVEDESTVSARLACAILDRVKTSPSLLAYAFCLQGRCRPTKEVMDRLALAAKDPNPCRHAYTSLQARRKHDLRSREAITTPYEVFLLDLTPVHRGLTCRDGDPPDPESHLLVPPCGLPALCLLRRSLRLVDEDLVERFRSRPESSSVCSSLIPDRREWRRGYATPEELLCREIMSATEERRAPEVVRLRTDLGLSEVWECKRGHPSSIDACWIERYLKLLFSYRVRVLIESPRPPEPVKSG
jgi:hypothetical protein